MLQRRPVPIRVTPDERGITQIAWYTDSIGQYPKTSLNLRALPYQIDELTHVTRGADWPLTFIQIVKSYELVAKHARLYTFHKMLYSQCPEISLELSGRQHHIT